MAAGLVLDLVEWQSLFDEVQLEDLLDALLVLQNRLHARLLQRGVVGREQGDVAQMIDGGHDVVPVIANDLVKLVDRSVLLFLHGEKRFLSIGHSVLAAPRFLQGAGVCARGG